MRPSFRQLLAIVMALSGIAFIVAGAITSALWSVAAGFGLLVLCLLAVCLVLYRHLVSVVLHLEDRVQQDANQRSVEVQRDKRLHELATVQADMAPSLTSMASRLTKLVKHQVAFEERQQQFDETMRTSTRQTADAAHFVLNAFDKLSARHRQIAEKLQGLQARLDTLEGAATRMDDEFAQLGETTRSLEGNLRGSVESQGERITAMYRDGHTETLRETEGIGKDVKALQSRLDTLEGAATRMDDEFAQLGETTRSLEGNLRGSVESQGERITAMYREGHTETLREAESIGKSLKASQTRLDTLEGVATRMDDGFALINEATRGMAADCKDSVKHQGDRLVSVARSGSAESAQEVEAILQLEKLFDFRGIRALLGGWAMAPSSMLALLREVRTRKPKLIVECGSGSSTLWLAYALAQDGQGRIASLEHLAPFAQSTRALLEEHDLAGQAEVRLAPLVNQTIGGETYEWYDPTALDGLSPIDILIVDGPPKSTGPMARYPAIPLLADKLAAQALIIVDDTNREPEKQAMKRWAEEVPGIGAPANLAGRTSAIEFRRP